jgi:dTDP-D-glucose 4,6-dehydratase
LHLETRVLITGGAGFLGSHLSERLLKQGANVICIDNYFTGTRRNIENMLDHHGFEVIRHDVTFPLYVEADQIYNLACPASPVHYQHDPVQTTKTSVHGAINMLGLAKRLRAKILQASTSEIYGDPSVHPQVGARQSDRPTLLLRRDDVPRHCFSTIGASTSSPSKWLASSIPTGRACTPMMVGWFRTLSSRRCSAATSPYSAMACRPDHSVMLMIWSMASCG